MWDDNPSSSPQVVYSSGRSDSRGKGYGNEDAKADLRLLHYNDVYHVDESSSEPVGGLPRFMTLVKEYQETEVEPKVLTLFSGDAFNPSLESSVTKGRHMVPVLNTIGTQVACVGNHDFDFGVKQFMNLTAKTTFPWLLANVLDPALGPDTPLGNAKKTHMLTSSNGIKVGFIGLGEREWLETINSLPPNIQYFSATETAKKLVPKLREEGADIVVCLSHQREPNDDKLAEQTNGLMDIILGGHDHYYSHSFIKGTHVLRSGTDFKQLSYLEARRKQGGKGWDFDIWRRDITSDIAPHAATEKLSKDLTSKLQKSLGKAVGWTATPLDARFSTVRLRESNMGNFVCDIMRHYHNADCVIMAAGTIRGDQVYPPGALRIKDLTTCFPFEDPVVLLRVTGKAIWGALENAVGSWPALEGRFPQVSGIEFEFDVRKEKGKRISYVNIGGEKLDDVKKYVLATRGYMGRGKDGYTSLLVQSEGGDAEELVDEENGILISAMLRQYFLSLRTVGQWQHLSEKWHAVSAKVQTKGKDPSPVTGQRDGAVPAEGPDPRNPAERLKSGEAGGAWADFLHKRLGLHYEPHDEDSDEGYSEWEHNIVHGHGHHRGGGGGGGGDDSSGKKESGRSSEDAGLDEEDQMDLEVLLMKKFWARWVKKAGKVGKTCDPVKEGEFNVDWTRVIAPVLEGRIKIVGEET